MGMRIVTEVRQGIKLYAQTEEGRNREFQKKMQSSANSTSSGGLLEEDWTALPQGERTIAAQEVKQHMENRGYT